MLLITGFYAALLALIILWLCYRVVVFRRVKKIEIGDGGDDKGIRHIRAQQNAVEYIPIVVLLMATYEMNQGNSYLLHGIGIAMVIARLMHPSGFVNKKGVSFGRFYGTALTWLCLLVLAIANVWAFASAMI
ncbi:MAPEG family protein [Marinicella sediminis]|uniref:MAPEG family protein n=1 Tax=Marinicella sediminis TaxID=1792834 RepID=A0ABV7JGH7_9GAMM|nr:MAPEG family protein [Marinicella sediminis]